MTDPAPYPGLHPDLWPLVRQMAADPNPVPDHQRPIEDLRAAVARMEAGLPSLATDIKTHDWHLPCHGRDVPLRSYETATPRAEVMLYMHGGGWSLGTLRGHDEVCADIARDTGMRVVSIDYALAPEHPYPAALDECVAAFAHLASGQSPMKEAPAIWLGGDSAGGNLALGTALKCPEAVGLFLIYPATDPRCASASYTTHGEAPYLTRAMMHRCWRDYLGGHPPDAFAAPASADLTPLPPAVILTAALDPLLGDGERLAAALRKQSKLHWYEAAEGLIHGFIRWRTQAPAAASAFARATQALARAMDHP
ncbi:alpha/beta hydrolase [Gymnodinialimonas ceratoperidinii]|uniref:Alpha/beta hydrolase n=1 Tax=Gymnodinialimonas ceratoperidinii TaxID=2856823 RepID=A0A8F6TXN7_9RHOB|nr:alpha/beta hydrolase [Gymnodinialimonas ceratoperidinii]QXT39839.1 alpha/beta hydrolase [Gymnodinialimonas ceratoperidinii]